MITQDLFSMVTRNGRDVNCHRTNWPQSSNIKLHQSRHLLRPRVHMRPGETAAGRLVSKLGLAQGLVLDGWGLPSMTIAQLTLIGWQIPSGSKEPLLQ